MNPENGLKRPTDLKGQTRAQLIMARTARSPPKGRIHLRRLVFSTNFPLQSCGGPYITGGSKPTSG